MFKAKKNWRRSIVFIVNFWTNFTPFSNVSTVDFEKNIFAGTYYLWHEIELYEWLIPKTRLLLSLKIKKKRQLNSKKKFCKWVALRQVRTQMCDLVPFVQFKKRDKHRWRTVTFSKVAGWGVLEKCNNFSTNLSVKLTNY